MTAIRRLQKILSAAFAPRGNAYSGTDAPEFDEMVLEETILGLQARVILYNDEEHTFDEVIYQLIKATGCSTHRAEELAFEVDGRGLACVYQGDVTRCLGVSSVLQEIALHTSVEL